ncbi:MAG: OB-fold nucleic acid binding domain-containing protein, partial [Phycisphaerales bacterium]|nr:OB-fold nucleic acid binding domain-containing protein [Phycisphaerales bacterium]
MTFDLGTTTLSDILLAPDQGGLIGKSLSVSGWVRSRRDSKAGLSFIQLSDGTCFDLLQLVVPSDLENYETEILQITTGASIIATGELVESQGKGQTVEMQATEI